MTTVQHMTVRDFRKDAGSIQGEWIAMADAADGAYTVRCGDAVLCSVNTKKPRRFRSLEVVRKALEELGVTEFRVNAAKN